jgi:hypothetical protein
MGNVLAQGTSDPAPIPHTNHSVKVVPVLPAIPLNSISTMDIPSEAGGAFMFPAICDEDGNLYIRKYASDHPMLGPIVKIDRDGKRAALFDPAAFSKLDLSRSDSFTPSSDGGIYQIAQAGVVKPQIYVLHYSSDGSASSPVRLDADFEVYSFAAFAEGNFLASGMDRDVTSSRDRGKAVTAVFSADGRRLGAVSFAHPPHSNKTATGGAATSGGAPKQLAWPDSSPEDATTPLLDLSLAQTASDGNVYVLHPGSPAVVYVISPDGNVERALKLKTDSGDDIFASAFHVSGNRLAVTLSRGKSAAQTIVVMDAQTGQPFARYSVSVDVGPMFACYSANESSFTFLNLGEGNTLQVIRAKAQ